MGFGAKSFLQGQLMPIIVEQHPLYAPMVFIAAPWLP